MGLPGHAHRLGAGAWVVILGWLILSSPTPGQEVGQGPASGSIDASAMPGDTSEFDAGQETPAPPATPPPAPDPYPDGPWSSGFLLGDPFGLRAESEERGASFYATFTQFEQGVASGGLQRESRWGGKFDLLAHLDSDKLRLWEGGTFDLFAESRLGQSVDGFAGVFSPTNLAMFLPVPDEQIAAITGLKFTQAITERSGIFFGKLNALNGDREKFLKYPLTSRFWNAAFNFNLTLDRYPYSAPGTGFYTVPERGPALALLVLDAFNSPRTSGLQKLGRNGVFLYAEAKQTTKFFGLPGQQLLAGLYGTGSFTDLEPASFIELPPGPALAPLKAGTWTLLWHVDQRLWIDPDETDRGVGLYVQTGLGDGNPNPVRWFLSAAICGNSPLPGRKGDTFGAGFYYLAPSGSAKNLAPSLRDEPGVELFYNVRIRPGCHLTPDLQMIHPGPAPVATAVLFGIRLKLDF